MFTRYDYNAGATKADIMADLVLLATGTTDKNLLSTSCNKTSTYIISTVASGWQLWDAAAGTDMIALRAPNNNGTTYKYMVLSMSGTTTDINVQVYESWNATTHVGTNLAANSNETGANNQSVSLTNGGTLFIGASIEYLFIYSLVSSVFSSSGFSGIFERTNNLRWDTSGTVIPPYVWTTIAQMNTNESNGIDGPRATRIIQEPTAGDAVGGYAKLKASTIFGCAIAGGYNASIAQTISNSLVWNASYAQIHQFIPISLVRYNQYYGDIKNIFITTNGFGTAGDEVEGSITDFNPGETTYFICTSGTLRIAVPKF